MKLNDKLDVAERTKTILVVDDRANWRNLLKTIFDSEGEYVVITAGSVGEAQSRMKEFDVGVLITNLGLEPQRGSYDRSGLELIKMIQNKAPGTPCIILTAFDDSIRDQVRDFCSRHYQASIWIMWKWGNDVYQQLRQYVQISFGESSEDAVGTDIAGIGCVK